MDQSAYRSELVGLTGIITYITSIVKNLNLTNVKVEVACDGKSALRNIFDEWHSNTKTSMKHYDVISYTRSLIKNSSVYWDSRHVYGHRDKITTDLIIWEKLNVIVDELATEYWNRNKFQYKYAIPLSDGFPTLTMKGEAVCSKLRKTIQQRSNFADWFN